MITYDIREGDFIQLLSIFFFIGDVKHVSRSVSSISMMSYRRMSIGTITDRINGENYDYRKDSDLKNWYGY